MCKQNPFILLYSYRSHKIKQEYLFCMSIIFRHVQTQTGKVYRPRRGCARECGKGKGGEKEINFYLTAFHSLLVGEIHQSTGKQMETIK